MSKPERTPSSPPPANVPGLGTTSSEHIEWAAENLRDEEFAREYRADAAYLIRERALSEGAAERLRSLIA